jgi:hypothetical protein
MHETDVPGRFFGMFLHFVVLLRASEGEEDTTTAGTWTCTPVLHDGRALGRCHGQAVELQLVVQISPQGQSARILH